MAITKLRIKNFKGVKEQADFEIRPITLFLGPNSSGKSSCIHAIAALAQTVKLPNSGRPLVLDDEYAQVHLGRFIEVIHSKKYTDSIAIGFDTVISDPPTRTRRAKGLEVGNSFSVDYDFRSTRRTQDIFLQSLRYKTGASTLEFSSTPTKSGFDVSFNGKTAPIASPATTTLAPVVLPLELKDDADIQAYILSQQFGQIATRELSRVLYLGPFRQSPLRRYPTRGSSPREVGAQGENTITLLANEHVQSKKRPHIKEVSEWLEQLALAKRVEVSRLGASDMFDVQVQLTDGERLPIADLGYGMSQVLPVLTQCSFAEFGSTLLFEQPELHLHSSSAEKMAGVLVKAQQSKGVTIIAETHSRELLIGLLHEIREGRLSVADLAVYTVIREGGCSVFKRLGIEVDENGRPECYDPWQSNL